jgi:hypothetical protein
MGKLGVPTPRREATWPERSGNYLLEDESIQQRDRDSARLPKNGVLKERLSLGSAKLPKNGVLKERLGLGQHWLRACLVSTSHSAAVMRPAEDSSFSDSALPGCVESPASGTGGQLPNGKEAGKPSMARFMSTS